MSFVSHREECISAKDAAIAKALEMIGSQAELYAKREITKKKAVDTGRLRNSISHAVKGDSAYVGTNVEYAPYIEFGTYRMAERPYLRPAAMNHSEEYKGMVLQCLKGQ